MIALSFLVFSLLYLAPGDPARVLLGTRRPNPALLEAIREQYHLSDPLISQYGNWVENALHLDFGHSIRTGQPVGEMIGPHLKVSAILILLSLLGSILLGLILGIISAKRRGRLADKLIHMFAMVGTAAPGFAVGLLLLYVLAFLLGWFPLYGLGDGSLPDILWSLTLPALTLTLGVSAMLIRITRAAMLREVGKDYSLFMRARAVSSLRITGSQLRNAAIPILTSAGLVLATLIGSTVMVETAFAIPGVGHLLASSVYLKDVPVVQFLTLILAFFICLTSALVDVGVYFLNPVSLPQKGGRP